MVDMSAARPAARTMVPMKSPPMRVMSMGTMESASLPVRPGNSRRPSRPRSTGRAKTTVHTRG